MSPEAFDERLKWATTNIFGNVETKCMMLYYDFFDRQVWKDKFVTFPDRFQFLIDWIQDGGTPTGYSYCQKGINSVSLKFSAPETSFKTS